MRIRRIILFLLWLLSLLAISFYGGAVSYGVFFCVTLIPLISLVYLCLVHARFRIYQEIGSRAVVSGQRMPYFFVLQNGDFFGFTSVSVRLFPRLSYVEKIPDDMEFELLPGERYTFETNLVCRYRGEYEVGVKEVLITDFFRIFRLRYRLPSTIKALVHPQVIHLESLESIPDVVTFVQRDAYYMQNELDVTLREYRAGDAIKQIHWKAAAKEQKLMTRNRIGEEKQGILLFFDTKRYEKDPFVYLPLENQILEVTLALGMFFSKKQVSYTAYWEQNGCRNCRVEGITHFDAFYEQTSRILFSEENKAFPKEQISPEALMQANILIGVVHEITEELFSWTEQLASAGKTIVLYVVTNEAGKDYMSYSTTRRRIIIVPVEAELEGLL